VIVARVEPRRLMLDSGCWWDVGVAEVSERAETRELAAEHARGRARRRHYG
jgi:TPP-dependent trihydroxycyclohexane-1,2-dione (THcHDO) dehydratase